MILLRIKINPGLSEDKQKDILWSRMIKSRDGGQCVICGSTKDVDPSHIKSVGSGGGDVEYNLVAHCRRHHIEWHKLGPFQFFRRHPIMVDILEALGWEICWLKGKIWHE